MGSDATKPVLAVLKKQDSNQSSQLQGLARIVKFHKF